MENILPVAIGAGCGLIGAIFGSWFTARRQDRMWLREQKLKAGVGFNTAVVQLLDHLRQTRLGDDGPGTDELVDRMQEARSALYLLCGDDTVELADALARRVWSTLPTEGRQDRKAEHRETLDLLRRFTHQLRLEITRP
ncbi:hypothetical protein [Streptomyces tsukubensis]|uniref:Uncharacterized protein n=1 Tax=Streptomyces tsukubensis TaxID=83656 RepID=A0A1V4A1D9_9ACTN|nr:hypothetical protein [Streptomyces tsukubensis]OON72745.1 hypothetical protein B1H18_28790 [Streptomyces tsukubensis]QFR96845.1 hypothetical protein GBW32_32160 [Streptomyces tsukubensis]